MRLVLQSDDVSHMEKQAVRHAAMLTDNINISIMSLADIEQLNSETEQAVPACPVGTIEFVKKYAAANKIYLGGFITYPMCLMEPKFFRRNIQLGFFSEAKSHEFIKPAFDIKSFTGNTKTNLTDLVIDQDAYVFISDPVEFIAEWRFYITNGALVGFARYDDNEEDGIFINIHLVIDAIKLMTSSGYCNFSLDFGVLSTGETCLVEANDGYAMGYYKGSCSQASYTELLWSRWSELCQCRVPFVPVGIEA